MTKAEKKVLHAMGRMAQDTQEATQTDHEPQKKKRKGRRPFTYKIIKRLAVLSQGTAISKEVNVIQYADDAPRLDVRCWKRKDGTEMLLNGISFKDDEAVNLEKAIHQYNQEKGAQESNL